MIEQNRPQINKKKSLWRSNQERIIVLILVLTVIGASNTMSTSYVVASEELGSGSFFFVRYLIYSAIGLLGMLFLAKVDYHIWLRKQFMWMFTLLTITSLVAVKFVGLAAGGAKRWLGVGAFTIQPSEFAKIFIVLITVSYLSYLYKKNRTATLFSFPFVVATIIAYLVYTQPDLGTAAIIWMLALGLLMIYGISKIEFVLITVLGAAGAVLLSTVVSYRAERLKAWLDPWQYKSDEGYQAVQGLLAIGSGGISGSGLGNGLGKYYYLPEAHTDFAFAIFCQEWGFIGAIMVIFIFLRLFFSLNKVATTAYDGDGFLLATGINLLIIGQAIGNIAMVTGLLPVIGVPLPFISYGGTAMISTFLAVGIALNIQKQSDNNRRRTLALETKKHLRLVK